MYAVCALHLAFWGNGTWLVNDLVGSGKRVLDMLWRWGFLVERERWLVEGGRDGYMMLEELGKLGDCVVMDKDSL